MCVGHKPNSFGNENHSICCGLTSILWRSKIVESKYGPRPLGQKEYKKLGKTERLMSRRCRPIFGSGKAVVLDSGFIVAKGITQIKAKDVYAGALIKKLRYCLKGVPGDLIDNHFEDKEVGDVGMLEASFEDKKLFTIFCIK